MEGSRRVARGIRSERHSAEVEKVLTKPPDSEDELDRELRAHGLSLRVVVREVLRCSVTFSDGLLQA